MSDDDSDGDRATVELHDRTFQRRSIEKRLYYIPVDEDEEIRLEIQNRVFQKIWAGRLFFAPIDHPRRVLDLGYGLGDWATAVAETYEGSEVTGVDIWPAEIADETGLHDLQTRDLNQSLTRWADRDHYDLIHSRCVGPGIQRDRWRSYVRDIHRLLRRGGWTELSEWSYLIQSDSGRMTDQSMVYQWTRAYRATMEQDRNPRVSSQLAGLLTDAGFTEINSRVVNVPLGGWHDLLRVPGKSMPTLRHGSVDPDTWLYLAFPRLLLSPHILLNSQDPLSHGQPLMRWLQVPHMRELGVDNREQVDLMLDSHAILPFTTRLQPQWTADDVKRLTDGARAEMRDDSLKLYMPLHIVWAQKRR